MEWNDVVERVAKAHSATLISEEDGDTYRGPIKRCYIDENKHGKFFVVETKHTQVWQDGKWTEYPNHPIHVNIGAIKSKPSEIGNDKIEFNIFMIGTATITFNETD